MSYTYTFLVESSGTLNPDGSTISGSINTQYSNPFYVSCPQGNIGLFKHPNTGYTYSGVDACFYPIEGTNIIRRNIGCGDTATDIYDYQVIVPISYSHSTPTYLFTLSGNSKIISLQSEITTSFSGGYRENLTLYSGFQNESSGITYIMGDSLLNGDYITHVGCNVYDPYYADPATVNLTIKLCEQTSASGFVITDLLNVTHSGTGNEWFKLSNPIKIPETGNYKLGIYSDNILYGFSRPLTGKYSYSKIGNCTGSCDEFTYESDYYHSCTAYYTPSYSIGTLSNEYEFITKLNLVDDVNLYSNQIYVNSNTGVYLNSNCFHPDTQGSGNLIFNCRSYVPTSHSGSEILYEGNYFINSDIPTNTLSGNLIYYLYSSSIESNLIQEVSSYIDSIFTINYAYDQTISGSLPVYSYLSGLDSSLNEYSCTPTIEKEDWVLILSFRKDTSLLMHSIVTAETYFSIIRCFSGFMGKASNCWSCDYFPYCGCDIKGSIVVYSESLNQVSTKEVLLGAIETSIKNRSISSSTEPDAYIIPQYDFTNPYIYNMVPSGGSILNHPSLLWQDEQKVSFSLRDTVTSLSGLNTGIWVKRIKDGYSTNDAYDNFNFYNHNFISTTSGYGWISVNSSRASKFIVNENMSDLQYAMDSIYYNHLNDVSLSGTGYLEIKVPSGTALSNSPMLYCTIPSGNNNWYVNTKMNIVRDGLGEKQWAGLALSTSPLVTSGNYIYFVSANGNNSKRLIISSNQIAYTVSGNKILEDPDDIYLKLERNNNTLYCKWSHDDTIWNTLHAVTLSGYTSDLYVGPIVINDNVTQSSISARYDYMKVHCSGVHNFISFGDTWELLTHNGNSINTTNNTGLSNLTRSNSKQYSYSYSLNEGDYFEPHEEVYFRSTVKEENNFKINYSADDSLLFITGDRQTLVPITTQITQSIIDLSPYNHDITIVGSGSILPYRFSDSSSIDGVQGNSCIDFHTNSYLRTEYSYDLCLDSDWSLHSWVYIRPLTTCDLLVIRDSSQEQIALTILSSGYLGCRIKGVSYTLSTSSISFNSWNHLCLTRKDGWIYGFVNGKKQLNGVYYNSSFSTNPCKVVIGSSSFYGYMDLVVYDNLSYNENFYEGNILDTVFGFRVLDQSDLQVNFNIVPDSNPPKLIDVSPARNTTLFCPTQEIVFDVLDDYSGVNWDTLNVEIDGSLLIQNGQDISSRVGRGTLSWETRGQLDGECVSYGPCPVEEVSEPGAEYDKLFVMINPLSPTYCNPMVSGVNRLLYPPGTTYHNSGAWGYRFTYKFNENELAYDHNIIIKVWGQDNYLEPNLIDDQYSIYVITNKNIQSDNFFIPVGESTTVYDFTELTCDFYDIDYPITDIVTASSYLMRSDGKRTETCSGIYWTTISGEYPVYTLHYKPEDYFRWSTERKTTYTVTIVNNNTYCYIEREFEFVIKPGWRVYWDHKNYKYPLTDRVYNPFPYDSNISIFVLIKNNTFMPNKLLESCTFHIVKPLHKDLYVTLEPRIIHKDLYVTLKPHTPYLEYGEWVECTVQCEDMAGNQLSYTWFFKTEDAP